MNLRKCKNGHFYDADRYVQCPHCNPDLQEIKSSSSYAAPAYINSAKAPAIQKETSSISVTLIIERIISWLFYSVFFSLLPIGMYTFLNNLFEFGINNTDKYISDLFVVTLVISSTTLILHY